MTWQTINLLIIDGVVGGTILASGVVILVAVRPIVKQYLPIMKAMFPQRRGK